MSHGSPDASLSRRDLLKVAGATGAAFALSSESAVASDVIPTALPHAATMMGVPFERHSTVRVAIVGTGLRGTSVLRELLAVDGVQVTALCDVVAAKAQRGAKMVTDAGQPAPALFTDGDHAFEQLVQRDDIDIVYTATPWPWHTPVCLAALRAGKHAATEVPAATTLEEAWSLVEASERTRRHCLMMENCCYDFNEMLIDTMVKKGLFGEVLYAEAAYIHDLRELLFEDRDEGLWRRLPHTNRQGNFYPTHGLGPVAWYLDIHRGDRFDYLVSMATAERGLTLWREAHVPKDNAKWGERYVEGDMNTSLIKTMRGKTILLQHTVTMPTPYDRLNSIRGTKGVFKDYPARIYLDGQTGGERFQSLDTFKAEHTHPLWQRVGEIARQKGGHGGMDYIMAYRLAECMREGLPPDFDVYDAAAWSAPWPLSEASLKKGSAPMKFPDFTRGAWQRARTGA
ncbi:MAG: Gfo/Idh/MocA family oxidoreductase [Gemmatimonadota bacterium]